MDAPPQQDEPADDNRLLYAWILLLGGLFLLVRSPGAEIAGGPALVGGVGLACAVAGQGLLRRRTWARPLACAVLLAMGCYELVRWGFLLEQSLSGWRVGFLLLLAWAVRDVWRLDLGEAQES